MDPNSQHVKTIQTDKRAKNRLRYASSRQRSKNASADVYRSYKRRIGNVTSSANREEDVHNRKRIKVQTSSETSRSETRDTENGLDAASSMAEELELALDRNASIVFKKFYHELWPLVRSLPEILHHAEEVVGCLLRYLLSNSSSPEDASEKLEIGDPLQVNLATTDILHLLGVLARDLRHESHRYLPRILERLLVDLLNPPQKDKQQSVPLDVTIVEAMFRTLAYILRYDAEVLVSETVTSKDGDDGVPCLERLRPWYSKTLAHRRDLVRRLAAESFAPLIRRLTSKGKKKHVRRVLRALATSGGDPAGPAMQRLQEDAVDGISTLCFEIARGIAGEIHTKGDFVFGCMVDEFVKGHNILVWKVIDSFLGRLLAHLKPEEAVKISCFLVDKTVEIDGKNGDSLMGMVKLCHKVSIWRNSNLVVQHSNLQERLKTLLKDILEYDWLKADAAVTTLRLVCAVWRTSPDREFFAIVADRLSKLIGKSSAEVAKSLVGVMTQDLVPYLPVEEVMPWIGSAVLEAACSHDGALDLVHCIASARSLPEKNEGGTEITETDDIIFLDNAMHCNISSSFRKKLLDSCMVDLFDLGEENLPRLLMSIQTCAFLAVCGTSEPLSGELVPNVSSWMMELLEQIDQEVGISVGDEADRIEVLVLFGVTLDMFAKLLSAALGSVKPGLATKYLTQVRPFVIRYLSARPSSIWALKSADSFVSVCADAGLSLSLNFDDLFELLLPNLRSSYFFHRLHTLKILASFPKKPFVVDHADLDLVDDLDEEPVVGGGSDHLTSRQGVDDTGPCDVLEYLLRIELTRPELASERRIASMISKVEVMGRSGRLPVLYADAAANHLLGLLNVKFAPVWESAMSAIAVLSLKHCDSVYHPVHRALEEYMYLDQPARRWETVPNSDANGSLIHLQRCCLWETIGPGALFGDRILLSRESGVVSCHEHVDSLTVLKNLWRVIETAPRLLLSHSRSLVPSILCFLHHRYFCLHAGNPDALELQLADHVPDETSSRLPVHLPHSLSSKRMEQIVCSILKAVAKVKGPEQLYKHRVLFSVFVAFVGHRDNQIALLSLECLLRFKVNHLAKYSDQLTRCFGKGKFREALLEMKPLLVSETRMEKSKPEFLGILSRLLLGRLHSQAGTKSSKDSPSARRTMVLSFLGHICHHDSELHPFLYLTIRRYLPSSFKFVPIEDDRFDSGPVIDALQRLTQSQVLSIPVAVHVGFLNMLQSILSQFGYRAQAFLPAYLSIVLGLCRAYGIGREHLQESEEQTSSVDDSRFGAVRSDCYLCLGEMLTRFEVIDLTKVLGQVNSAVSRSFPLLGEMCSSSEKVPSFLNLLLALSSAEDLITFFALSEECVPSIFACLDEKTCMASTDVIMRITDNLVKAESSGLTDVASRNFSRMLNGFERILSIRGDVRVLEVLASASDLMDNPSISMQDPEAIADRLSKLLVPFLRPERGIREESKQNVIRVLERLYSRLSAEGSRTAYEDLSILLGPSRWKPGITSTAIRQGLAMLIGIVAGSHFKIAIPTSAVVVKLCSTRKGRVDEADQDAVVEALGKLETTADEASWVSLVRMANDAIVLLPLVRACFNCIFSEDGITARCAFRAIKALIPVAYEGASVSSETLARTWKRLFEGHVVRLSKDGLGARTDAPRRLCTLLLSEIASTCKESDSLHHYGDLAQLGNENPDIDFFRNITHVQIHRQARALRRLRNELENQKEEAGMAFSPFSLSNVILPICLHPVYESKSNMTEQLALEAIPTVGVVCRYLSWSKYNNTLWTALCQIERRPDQERFLVDAVCSILDNFHFAVEKNDNADDGSVSRALNRRIIPKLESILTKEKIRSGRRDRVLRPVVVLALLKLFRRFSREEFEKRLPRLLTVVCDALRDKESDARDLARNTLTKMVVEMGLAYMDKVIHQLSSALTDGYQLHVRAATLHSILLAVSENFKPSATCAPGHEVSPLDRIVPGIMEILLQDLFGDAQERRDAEGSQVRFVKEAGGAKSSNSLEILASLVTFRPSLDSEDARSAVHQVALPFIERLSRSSEDATTLRRSREYLQRITSGLSRNPSTTLEEVLPFVQASLSPFLGSERVTFKSQSIESDDSVGEALAISGGSNPGTTENKSQTNAIARWNPSTLAVVESAKAAQIAKVREEKSNFSVVDGASAPKLTGSFRQKTSILRKTKGSQRGAAVVQFGLHLLHLTLKRSSEQEKADMLESLDGFCPLLTSCVTVSREEDVILLAMKCLGILFRLKVPSLETCSIPLATRVLELLVSEGGSGSNQEMLQACFKLLSLLMNSKRPSHTIRASSNVGLTILDESQMQVLLSFLKASIVDSEQHQQGINLLRAIMAKRYVSAELYDLMENILEQCVRSSKASLRSQFSDLFVAYLLDYPMGEDRREQHLKQIVLNIRYEYEEGRASGIDLVNKVLNKLPDEVLEKYATLLCLPLTVQLVNDKSKVCREKVAFCLSTMMKRASKTLLRSVIKYAETWSRNGESMLRTSLQLLGLMIESRQEFLDEDMSSKILTIARSALASAEVGWHAKYFALVCLEKSLYTTKPLLSQSSDIWLLICDHLPNKHPWVRLAASRLILWHFSQQRPQSLADDSFLTQNRPVLFRVAKNFCKHLDFEEDESQEDLTVISIKALTWIAQVIAVRPDLCCAPDDKEKDRDPSRWLVTRLASTARQKGTKRRQAIFKCFAALASTTTPTISEHLLTVLEALHRAEVEAQNETDAATLGRTQRESELSDEGALAQEVIQLLADKYDERGSFTAAYAAVRKKALEKREKRKLFLKTQAVTDPQLAASRRIQKQDREKARRKRRVADRRDSRSGIAKRRHVD